MYFAKQIATERSEDSIMFAEVAQRQSNASVKRGLEVQILSSAPPARWGTKAVKWVSL